MSNEMCPICHNRLVVAGELKQGEKIYYCEICDWRGDKSEIKNVRKRRRKNN